MSRREQMSAMRRSRTDILILGSGGAGLFSAWHAARAAPGVQRTVAGQGVPCQCRWSRPVPGRYNPAASPGGFVFVQARAVLLATGGGPTMYKFHTPSGDKSCDGLAMALRAGLTLRDMEMVQFHPTGLLAGTGTRMTGTVLEEGLRGSGGYLLNGAKQRFMHKYDDKLERATRDIVSRGIFAEMNSGQTTPNGGVYISMAHLGPVNVT